MKSKGSSSESESKSLLGANVLGLASDLALTNDTSLGEDSDLMSGDSLGFSMRGLQMLSVLLDKDPPVVVPTSVPVVVTVSVRISCVSDVDGNDVDLSSSSLFSSFVLLNKKMRICCNFAEY